MIERLHNLSDLLRRRHKMKMRVRVRGKDAGGDKREDWAVNEEDVEDEGEDVEDEDVEDEDDG